MEQFANETFDRAERALRANKVTRQTADTFDAAATFLDLGSEWGALDTETLQKIKFAKWNAARILKAIKEGKDPNESNPKIAEAEQDTDQTVLAPKKSHVEISGKADFGESKVSRESGALDHNDPEVKELEALAARAATVEDIPDAGEQRGDNAPLQEQFQPSPQAPAENDYFPPAPSNVP